MPAITRILVFLAALLAGLNLRAMDTLVRSVVPVGIAADGQAGTVTTAGTLHNGRVTVDNDPDGAWANIAVTATGFSDTGHRWVPPASVIPSYDDDGNLLADGRWTYTWDAMNRLVAMAPTPNALAAGVPNQTITFAYDFASRRIGKKVTTTSGTGTTVTDTRYLYDGWSRGARRDPRQTADRRPGGRERNGVPLPSTCVAEFEYDDLGDMIPQATYVWSMDLSGTLQGAGGVGGLLSVSLLSSVSASSVFLPCYDTNGNIIAWTNGNGSPAQRQDYDPFGNLVIVERLAITPTDSARLTYGVSTKPLDAETGLHYYGYRYYDGRNGRWINQDPIGENGGLNLYGFVRNSPIFVVDILGKLAPNPILAPAHTVSGPPTSPSAWTHNVTFKPELVQTPTPFVEPEQPSPFSLPSHGTGLSVGVGVFFSSAPMLNSGEDELLQRYQNGEDLAEYQDYETDKESLVERKVREEENNGYCCIYKAVRQRGRGRSLQYAASLQGGVMLELKVEVMKNGQRIARAQYDASMPSPDKIPPTGTPIRAFEAKLGYRFFANPKLPSWWNNSYKGRPPRNTEVNTQFGNQLMVSKMCGFDYEIAISPLESVELWRAQFPAFSTSMSYRPQLGF